MPTPAATQRARRPSARTARRRLVASPDHPADAPRTRRSGRPEHRLRLGGRGAGAQAAPAVLQRPPPAVEREGDRPPRVTAPDAGLQADPAARLARERPERGLDRPGHELRLPRPTAHRAPGPLLAANGIGTEGLEDRGVSRL